MVLLVDDDPTTNFLHRRAIKKVASGTRVAEALNGREALDFLEGGMRRGEPSPELIFLDISMPLLDGWGFLEGYRELSPEWRSSTRVFMLTTSLNPDDHQRAHEYEVVEDVLDKILTKDKFERLLQYARTS